MRSVLSIKEKINSLRNDARNNYVTPRNTHSTRRSTRSSTSTASNHTITSRQRKRNLFTEYNSDDADEMNIQHELDEDAVHQATNRLSKDIVEERSSEDDRSVPDNFFESILD